MTRKTLMEFTMEFPIYFTILETMLTLTSTFGVFLIVIVQGSFLLLAYCWGANKVMSRWMEHEELYNWNDDDDEGGE